MTGGVIATGAAATSTSITTTTLIETATSTAATGIKSTTVRLTPTASGSIIQIIAARRPTRTGRRRRSLEATIEAVPITTVDPALTGTRATGQGAIGTSLLISRAITGPEATVPQPIGRARSRQQIARRLTIGHLPATGPRLAGLVAETGFP